MTQILARWEEQAYKEIASSLNVTSLVMQNHLKVFLEQLADALSGTIDRTPIRVTQDRASALEFSKSHGQSRVPLSFTLAEVILELQILRRVVLATLEEDGPLPVSDRDNILKVFDQTVSDAAVQFTAFQNDIHEQFSLTLVHDLRIPITVGKIAAQIIKRDSSCSANSTGAAEKIEKSMNRLEAMLQQLLDAGRIRSGVGLSYKFEEMRLDLLAKEVVEGMRIAHGNRIEIQADQTITGKWNRDGLYRAIENLVMNALKYGSSVFPVKVIVEQSESSATITVHNEGNPIPQKDQLGLFKQFVQGANVTTTTGWGLGLAVVSGVAKAHNGSVRVESSQAMGTDFILELPKMP